MNIQPSLSSNSLSMSTLENRNVPNAPSNPTDQKVEAVSGCISTGQATESTKTISNEIVISQLRLKASIRGKLIYPKHEIIHTMHNIRFCKTFYEARVKESAAFVDACTRNRGTSSMERVYEFTELKFDNVSDSEYQCLEYLFYKSLRKECLRESAFMASLILRARPDHPMSLSIMGLYLYVAYHWNNDKSSLENAQKWTNRAYQCNPTLSENLLLMCWVAYDQNR